MKVKNHSLKFTLSQFTIHDYSKILEISEVSREEVPLALELVRQHTMELCGGTKFLISPAAEEQR